MVEEIEDILNGVMIPPACLMKYIVGWLILIVMCIGTTMSHLPYHSDLPIGRKSWFGVFVRSQAAADAVWKVQWIAKKLRAFELNYPGIVPKRVFELNAQFCQNSDNNILLCWLGRIGVDPWKDCFVIDGINGIVRCKFDNPQTMHYKLEYEEDLSVEFMPCFRFCKAKLVGMDKVHLYLSKAVQEESAKRIKIKVYGKWGKKSKIKNSSIVLLNSGCRIELQLAEELDSNFCNSVVVRTEVNSVDGETIPGGVWIDFERGEYGSQKTKAV